MRRRRPTIGEHNVLGVYLNSRGAYDLAISELKKARRMAPLSPVIHYNLAAAYFGKRELDQALSSAKAALDLNPQYIKARLLLGFTLEARGCYQESRQAFEWVIGRDPQGRNGQQAKEALVTLEAKLSTKVGRQHVAQ